TGIVAPPRRLGPTFGGVAVLLGALVTTTFPILALPVPALAGGLLHCLQPRPAGGPFGLEITAGFVKAEPAPDDPRGRIPPRLRLRTGVPGPGFGAATVRGDGRGVGLGGVGRPLV